MIEKIYLLVLTIWYAIWFFLIVYLYFKDSRPYDFEKEVDVTKLKRTLEDLSFIIYKKIKPEVMTGNIIKLINQSKIKVKYEDNDYILSKIDDENITKADFDLLELLFEVIGDNNKVKLSQIETFCNKKSGNSEFLMNYKIWEKTSIVISNRQSILEPKTQYGFVLIMRNFGLVLFVLNILLKIYSLYGFIIVIPAIFSIIYFYKISKLNNEYQQEYFGWLKFRGEIRKNNSLLKNNDYLEYSVLLKCFDVIDDNRKKIFIESLDRAIRKCCINSTFRGDRSLF